MELKELRLGNIINRPVGSGGVFKACDVSFFENQIVGVDKGKDDTKRYDVRCLRPIDLDEEWLLALGLHLYREIATDGISFAISRHDIESKEWHFTGARIRYVHQLQNLYFALTGEELTIEETV